MTLKGQSLYVFFLFSHWCDTIIIIYILSSNLHGHLYFFVTF